MSKRELEQLSGANEIEGPRTKRRRETAGTSSDLDMIHSDPIVGASNEISQGGGGKNEVVLEQGLKLWQTVKDAVNKECVESCLIRLFRLLLGTSSILTFICLLEPLIQREISVSRFPTTALKTTISRLL